MNKINASRLFGKKIGKDLIFHSVRIYTLFIAINALLLSECAAEYNIATKQEERLLISTEGEVKIGRNLARQVETKYKVCRDEKLQERVKQIGARVAAVCDRKDVSFSFTVLESKKVNAFALPGGYVYVNRALIEKTDSDDEIAGVFAHEIGHIVARHSVKRLQAGLGYNLLSILAVAATKNAGIKREADLAFSQIMLGYSREDELLADRMAVKYMKKSGYKPEAIISFLKKLKTIQKEEPLRPLNSDYSRTHPYLSERIAAVKQEVHGKMDFNDYINRGNYERR